MAAAMAHRGPDDRGIKVAGSVGLACTRLAIVDPSPAGLQPMTDPEERWTLTYNGEVFNHAEIRAQLPRRDYRGGSDTETVLHALGEWGSEAVERFNGLFAFAALDTAQRRLLLARDRFGVKPLYYARHDGALFFASEIRALMAAGIPPRPRREVLAHAATRAWPTGRATPLDGIERVPPGTLVTVDLETLASAEHRWYDPADAVNTELAGELAALDREELVSRLECTLRQAVRSRLMADVPIGTMCSGGLDSSLVCALARAEGGTVKAFAASMEDELREDEGPWAERATRALGVELHTVRVSADQWRARLVRAVSDHEYPLQHGGSVPIALIAKAARQEGVKALLTGEGADELFAGYGRHRAELGAFLPPEARALHGLRRPRRRRFRSVVRRLRRRPASLRQSDLPPPAECVTTFGRAVAARAEHAYENHPWPRGALEAHLLGDLSAGPLPVLLNRMDKDAMAESIETRVPFLDPAVVELALNLPLEARTLPAVKGILRDVGVRHLPAAVALRSKQPGLAVESRRRIEEAARPEFLAEGMLREELGLGAQAWSDLTARRGYLGMRVGMRLWTAEMWCRLVLDSRSVASVEADLWR
jgi:asparagine synthase (glutamine-hydrolysing)